MFFRSNYQKTQSLAPAVETKRNTTSHENSLKATKLHRGREFPQELFVTWITVTSPASSGLRCWAAGWHSGPAFSQLLQYKVQRYVTPSFGSTNKAYINVRRIKLRQRAKVHPSFGYSDTRFFVQKTHAAVML